MPKPDPLLFQLQTLILGTAKVDRNHYIAGTDRRENDIEHSYTVAMLCWYLADRHQLKLRHDKLLKYSLAHDLVECYAGDTNTFASSSERATKVTRENEALARINQEFAGFPQLSEAISAYEARNDEESLFVWTVDKMQAMILGDIDAWRPYREYGVSYEQFMAKHSEQLTNGSPYLKAVFTDLLAYCSTTFYDQP